MTPKEMKQSCKELEQRMKVLNKRMKRVIRVEKQFRKELIK